MQIYETNIENQANNFSTGIPYGKPCIDSSKFFIDTACFEETHIPKNFTLIDSDTGESLNDFKRSSLEIPYKDHKIYISTVKKILPNSPPIDKILIYFPAKIAGNEYFYGIQKKNFIEVLEHLKSIGYLKFNNANDIYKNTFVRDLDIKIDMKLAHNDKPEVKEYNKALRERFNGVTENFHLFDSKKQGFGIQTYERDKSTITKPFLKFYDKSKELTGKSYEFFNTLSAYIQSEVQDNFIYRYEFTLKDKRSFDKFGINNRLEDVHEVLESKWREIGKAFFNTNFQTKVKKPRDLSKLRGVEKTLALYFTEDIKRGLTVTQIKDKYILPQKDKKQRYRMSLLFERIYYFSAVDNENTKEIRHTYELVNKWDKFFGLIENTQKDGL